MTSSQPPIRRSLTLPTQLYPLLRQGIPELLLALDRLDVEAFSQWVVAGVSLFSQDELPTLQALTTRARTVLLTRAIERFDRNITHTAQALGTSRRALRYQLKQAGLYRQTRPTMTGGPELDPIDAAGSRSDDDGRTLRIVLEADGPQGSITRAVVVQVARQRHPAAVVYAEPGHPVLVDDGVSWLLFFDDWWNGCQYSFDGESKGLVVRHEHLEAILARMVRTYHAADPVTRERARQHTAELAMLSGAAVYERARVQANLRHSRERST